MKGKQGRVVDVDNLYCIHFQYLSLPVPHPTSTPHPPHKSTTHKIFLFHMNVCRGHWVGIYLQGNLTRENGMRKSNNYIAVHRQNTVSARWLQILLQQRAIGHWKQSVHHSHVHSLYLPYSESLWICALLNQLTLNPTSPSLHFPFPHLLPILFNP